MSQEPLSRWHLQQVLPALQPGGLCVSPVAPLPCRAARLAPRHVRGLLMQTPWSLGRVPASRCAVRATVALATGAHLAVLGQVTGHRKVRVVAEPVECRRGSPWLGSPRFRHCL